MQEINTQTTETTPKTPTHANTEPANIPNIPPRAHLKTRSALTDEQRKKNMETLSAQST